MQLLLVIPARIGSSRLPEKPLQLLFGEPLIRHTARNVLGYGLRGRVVVATDDARVARAVAPLGVRAVMTRAAHRSGTERAAEVACKNEFADADVIVNVQGDEPMLPARAASEAIERVVAGDPIVTVACPLGAHADADPTRVKVRVDRDGYARAFARDSGGLRTTLGTHRVLQHVGCYAYTRAALLRWVDLPPVPEEEREGLEQLRPLVHGMTIGTVTLDSPAPPAVDTKEDLHAVESMLVAGGCQ